MSTVLRSPAMKYGANFTSLSNLGFRATRPSEPAMFRRAPRGCELSRDRKSTRLNSSHTVISYAVFCLKKKTLDLTGVQTPGGVSVSFVMAYIPSGENQFYS